MGNLFRRSAGWFAVLLLLHAGDALAATKKKKPAGTAATTQRTRPAEPDEDTPKTPSSSAKKKKKKPGGTTASRGRSMDEDQPANARGSRTASKTALVPVRPLANGELPLMAKGAIVLDAFTGQPLYEKNADEAQYPASTTKIMTALLVIEEGDLDHEVEVTEEDSKVGESSLNILPGEHYTRREMLYGLMLKSANDVAHALGRDNAGSAEAFAEKMTRRARELGATNTSFRNANGLHDVQHYTSPRDLALIARAAMQQPYFRQVVGTQKYLWKRPSGEQWQLTNHNRLLGVFPGTTGVKTGYTNPAQQVLVSACLRDCREVIAVVMHDGKPNNWEDSRLLLNYGFEKQPGAGPVPRF